jgi:protein MpaA
VTENISLFDPAAYVRDVEKAARDGGWDIHYLTPCPSSTRPWLQRKATSPETAPNLYLSAGIHGDEISGPSALLELVRRPGYFADFNTTLFPILNPEGLRRNVRENFEGIDLNRDYRDTQSAEIASHIEALKQLGRFDGAMFLHEDFEGIGAYLYELNDTLAPGLGVEIITAMGRHVPIDLRPVIEEAPSIGGVIDRRSLIEKFGAIEDRPDWPEAIYLTQNHTRACYTTETPKPFPLEARVQAQIAAVATLMRALLEAKHSPPMGDVATPRH